ncbi:MAG: amidohydrolase family protein [Deltaproteobacteria bacterium]|nr:amidohydrolase family protein [Deltaproteobacteria bacterium]
MRALAASLAVLLAACPKAQRNDQYVPAARSSGVFDSHVHTAPRGIPALIEIMDEVGVRYALNLSGRWPGGPLEKQLEAANATGRVLVATTLPWGLAAESTDFPNICAGLVMEAKRLGARALKIEKALGLGVPKPDGSLLRVDDPWLDPIWQAAGETGLPVVIHTADPKAFWLPMNEKNERIEELRAHPGWSNAGVPGLPSFDELLAALMRVVAKHPKTRFVAVHFGNNAEDPEWVGRMLDQHPNLYADVAARLPELGKHEAKLVRRVFLRHKDRILFATDLGVGHDGLMLGSTGKEPNRREEVAPFFRGHWRYFETDDSQIPSVTPIQSRKPMQGIELPDEVLNRVYRENAIALFGTPTSSTAGAVR